MGGAGLADPAATGRIAQTIRWRGVVTWLWVLDVGRDTGDAEQAAEGNEDTFLN